PKSPLSLEPDIAVLTDYSSPYQVELFDLIEALAPGRLEVYYRTRRAPLRGWTQSELKHAHHTLDKDPAAWALARTRFQRARLVIFNFYTDPRVRALILDRAKSQRPWVFWGERPGYVSPRFGKFFRLWALRALHRSRAPIWGMGEVAIHQYQKEFGEDRSYVNLPYYSNLQPFVNEASTRAPNQEDPRIILYSGSLIHRKGVDLLANAFARLVATGEAENVRLRIMGRGDLETMMRQQLADCADKVEFIGFKDWNDLPTEYGKAHLLCAPSRHDGWGLIVPEGLASGLPVISTTSTGAAVDLIKPGHNGWLISANNEETLFSALREAATLPSASLHQMSIHASASVADHTLAQGARRFLNAADNAIRDLH
ncbi:MAG: glycosyltransferase family 4 protein, partial [Verrucomicrobiales bacterium]